MGIVTRREWACQGTWRNQRRQDPGELCSTKRMNTAAEVKKSECTMHRAQSDLGALVAEEAMVLEDLRFQGSLQKESMIQVESEMAIIAGLGM